MLKKIRVIVEKILHELDGLCEKKLLSNSSITKDKMKIVYPKDAVFSDFYKDILCKVEE